MARSNSNTRGYDHTWTKLRAAYIAQHPTCEAKGCTAPAHHVDHILALSKGGGRLDWDNLQALCQPCHNKKTAYFDRKRKRVPWSGVNPDGTIQK